MYSRFLWRTVPFQSATAIDFSSQTRCGSLSNLCALLARFSEYHKISSRSFVHSENKQTQFSKLLLLEQADLCTAGVEQGTV